MRMENALEYGQFAMIKTTALPCIWLAIELESALTSQLRALVCACCKYAGNSARGLCFRNMASIPSNGQLPQNNWLGLPLQNGLLPDFLTVFAFSLPHLQHLV
jgi:hypothetical protein